MDNTEVLNTLLSNARTALNEFESYTQEQVDALIRRVCLDFKAHAEELAREAVEETGMGNVESKIAKNRGAADGIWYSLKGKKSVGIIGYDDVQKMAYVAKPKGILSSVAPSTNPNLTVIFNACFGLKGRNVLIVAPHPGAKKARCTPCRSSMTLSPRWALPRTLSSASRNPPYKKSVSW